MPKGADSGAPAVEAALAFPLLLAAKAAQARSTSAAANAAHAAREALTSGPRPRPVEDAEAFTELDGLPVRVLKHDNLSLFIGGRLAVYLFRKKSNTNNSNVTGLTKISRPLNFT